MHRTTTLLRCFALALCAALLAAQPAQANCSAAMESCNSSCDSNMTSGFIVGLAGALSSNNAAYQQGQRQLQQAQACAQRCSTQYDACYQREQAQQQREEAARRAQQERAEAQQRAEQQRAQSQQRAQAERAALQRRVNRVVSPPVLPPPAIKDAAPLLLQAQAHNKNGDPFAATHIYKMVIQGSSQPKHQQAARNALRKTALDELQYFGMQEPGKYARILAEYGPLAVFTPTEHAQLAAMAPDSAQAEDAARGYLRKNPKGALRDIAEAAAQAAPQLRARAIEERTRAATQKALSDEAERLATIRNARERELIWARAKDSCLLYQSMTEGTLDVRWTGECKDDYATGTGTLQHLGAEDRILYQYDGQMMFGKREGTGKSWWFNGNQYEGEYRRGIPEGVGKFWWANGHRYEGEYRNGNRTKGSYWWPDGDRYQGEFVDNKIVGQGTYWFSKTNDYYIGEWANNQRLNGTLYWNDGRVKAIFSNGQRTDH